MPRLLALITGLTIAWPLGSTNAAAPTDPEQVITVAVASPTSTTGVLQAWERRG